MIAIDEGKNTLRYVVRDPAIMDKFRVIAFGQGVQITLGRIKGSSRWEIQNYIFEKTTFKSIEQITAWLDRHLKSEIRKLLDFRDWDEWKRRFVNAYVQISSVK